MKKFLLVLLLVVISSLFCGIMASETYPKELDSGFAVTMSIVPTESFKINTTHDIDADDELNGEITKEENGEASYSTYFVWNMENFQDAKSYTVTISAGNFIRETGSAYQKAILTKGEENKVNCSITTVEQDSSSIKFTITKNADVGNSFVLNFNGYIGLNIKPEDLYSLVPGTYKSSVTIGIQGN